MTGYLERQALFNARGGREEPGAWKGVTLFKIFKPITDITKQFGGMLEGARGLMETAGKGGLRGVVQEAFNFDDEGFKGETDRRSGGIIMRLTMAGDTERVETVIRFRNYAMAAIDELQRCKELSEGFGSEDLGEIRLMVDRMAEYLDSRDPEPSISDGKELLRQEIARLKQVNRQLSSLIESEEALLAGEGKPAGRYPTIVAAEGSPPKPKKYPVAGNSRKKPAPAGDKEAEEA